MGTGDHLTHQGGGGGVAWLIHRFIGTTGGDISVPTNLQFPQFLPAHIFHIPKFLPHNWPFRQIFMP